MTATAGVAAGVVAWVADVGRVVTGVAAKVAARIVVVAVAICKDAAALFPLTTTT
jgi:hypothetical protein